jgi:hypothetical protein
MSEKVFCARCRHIRNYVHEANWCMVCDKVCAKTIPAPKDNFLAPGAHVSGLYAAKQCWEANADNNCPNYEKAGLLRRLFTFLRGLLP